MQDVRNPLYGLVNDGAIGNASLHNFQSRLWLKHTVMAQSTNTQIGVITGLQIRVMKLPPTLPVAPVTSMCFMYKSAVLPEFLCPYNSCALTYDYKLISTHIRNCLGLTVCPTDG